MAMNPKQMMQLMAMKGEFERNHPKFPQFLRAAKNEIREGSVLEITITSPEGKTMTTNLKVTASDMQMVEQLKSLV